MYGLDGRISRTQTKMTWDEFSKWQRWDEFPELKENPPMTVDVYFFYNGDGYYIDGIGDEYVLQTESWEAVASDKCFLRLLTKPLEVFGGHSFQELIQELEFDA